ncbi:MAG: GNAT superfamily N-acetyltransferase [Crocinitomicaceae bacterium]|jgi:GNAT superfamily N-acetyltransferase
MPQPSSVTVFHLEMNERDAFRPSRVRPGFDVVIVDPPDSELNCRFYRAVGAQWEWNDRLDWSEDSWLSYVTRNEIRTYVGQLDGIDVGYFELEAQEGGNMEIVYFGLLPEYIGQGLGGVLLSAAIARAWEFSSTKRICVHTCTHDHKQALDNYRLRGFEVFRTDREPFTAD